MNVVEQFYDQKKCLKNLSLNALEIFDLGSLLADDITLFLAFGIRPYAFFKMLIQGLFDDTFFEFEEIYDGSILIFNSNAYSNRMDYKISHKNIKKIIDNTISGYERKKWKISKSVFRNFYLMVNWNRKLKKVRFPSSERYFIIKRLLKCYKFYVFLKQKNSELSHLGGVVFQFDGLDTENLFSQYCNAIGIPTFTLQHGHFHHTEFIDETNYFISVPFEGFVSDYFLAWGEYTKREAIRNGINEKKILEVGSLKTDYPPLRNSGCTKIFGVILNGTLGYIENAYLIDFAEKIYKKYGYRYILRPHPTKSTQDFLKPDHKGFLEESNSKVESIYDFAGQVDFCLCGNSSVFTELIFWGKPAITLKPKHSINTYEEIGMLSFSDENELWAILDLLIFDKNSFDNEMNRCKQLFFCTGNISETYQRAILGMIMERRMEKNGN